MTTTNNSAQTKTMNDIIGYLLKSVITSTYSLKKKSILIDKPWALVDNDGEIQKLIFKKNNGLVLSKNGTVTEGAWEYFPEAKALLINRGQDKILLNESFIDDNVLILKKDGTDNEFFSLANENTIPDYNIPRYLNSLKCKRLKIHEFSLINGQSLQIIGGDKAREMDDLRGMPVELVSNNYKGIHICDGSYLSRSRKYTAYIRNGRIGEIKQNIILELADSQTIEIEDGASVLRYGNLNKKVTQNGNLIPDSRIVDKEGFIYEIHQSRVLKILFVKHYKLKNGYWIEIEQQDFNRISRGDKLTVVPSGKSLPNGKYKVKGKFLKIEVRDSIVV